MGFVDEDIYAYTASELLKMPRTKRWTFWPIARKLWLACVVLATFALQVSLFILVFRATNLSDSNVSARDLMELAQDTRSNFNSLYAEDPCWDFPGGLSLGDSPPAEDIDACISKLPPGQVGPPAQPLVSDLALAAYRAAYKKANTNNTQRAAELTSIAVAFALVVLALCVHQEMVRAAILARVVLTHTGYMPSFFAPMCMTSDSSDNGQQVPADVGKVSCGVKLPLLLLPVMQLSSCLFALGAASVAFLHDAEGTDIISVILNSTALLFTLEFDNIVCAIIKELDPCDSKGGLADNLSSTTFKVSCNLPSTHSPRANSQKAGCSCGKSFGYIYIAIIGLAFFAVPFVTLINSYTLGDATYADDGVTVVSCTPSFISTNIKATAAFFVCYIVLMALLFDAPLSPASREGRRGSCSPIAWRVVHKVVVMVIVILLCLVTFFLEAVQHDCNYTDAAGTVLVALLAFAPVSWLVLYLLWPPIAAAVYARRDRRQQQAENDRNKGRG